MIISLESVSTWFEMLDQNVFLVAGMLLMLGVAGGMLANHFKWLPTITAFMALGLVMGPEGLGIVTKSMLNQATFLVDIALGLILYRLGNMLHLRDVLRSPHLLLVSFAESLLPFILVGGALLVIGTPPIVAAIVAAIAISSSPAVLVHVAEELHAEGPITERAKTLVAMNNVWSFLLFSTVLPFALVYHNETPAHALLTSFYRLGVALVIGVVFAFLTAWTARYLRPETEHYKFTLTIGSILLTIGTADMLHSSILFATLVLGIAVRWFEAESHSLSDTHLGEGADLFFVLLFVVAGAKIHLEALLDTGLIALVLVLLRCGGKIAGTFLPKYFTHDAIGTKGALGTGLMLLPMAGMAIGLITTTALLAPQVGETASSIIYAMIAILETAGPFVVTYALRLTGEAHRAST